jgi:hypothetical protein
MSLRHIHINNRQADREQSECRVRIRVTCKKRQLQGSSGRSGDSCNLLTGPGLLEMTDSSLAERRERICPPTVTLSMFTMHALTEDAIHLSSLAT